jgi:hypothetical protein
MVGALLLAAFAGTLALSDRTEFRLRDPGLVPGTGALDLETDPGIKLTLASRTATYLFEYTPQLAAWDMAVEGIHPAYLNNGRVRADWQSHLVRITLRENASYGSRNYGSLVLAPTADGQPPRVDVIPVARTFLYEASTTALDSMISLSRWTIGTSIAYQLGGGATEVARQTLPLQSGPVASLRVDHALTRTDHLITNFSGLDASFSNGVESALVDIDETWRRDWSRLTSSQVRAGFAFVRTRTGAYGSNESEPEPILAAQVSQKVLTRGQLGQITLSSQLEPYVNPLIGLVDERVGAALLGRYTHGRLQISGQISVAESVPPSRATGVRLFYSDVTASYRVSRAVLLELGSRALWQEPTQPQGTAPGGQAALLPVAVMQEVGFLAMTVQANPIRF